MTEQVRPGTYLEMARGRIALIRSALIGLGHEPDPAALAAATVALGEVEGLIEATLVLVAQQDEALLNLGRAVQGDAERTAAAALAVLPAGSAAVN